jgi:hypothetical protein
VAAAPPIKGSLGINLLSGFNDNMAAGSP